MIRRYHLAAIKIFHRFFSDNETTGFGRPTEAEMPSIDVEDGPLVRRRCSRISSSSQDGSSSVRRRDMTRQMVMIGFLQAQNCTNLPCSWRHPESRDGAHSADYYQEIARVLEAGKFHIAFEVGNLDDLTGD